MNLTDICDELRSNLRILGSKLIKKGSMIHYLLMTVNEVVGEQDSSSVMKAKPRLESSTRSGFFFFLFSAF